MNVFPAKAGIQRRLNAWIPFFNGMTMLATTHDEVGQTSATL
ncbi:MAG TPA: hypothetical protein VFY80_03915 [Burkholderiales bacterium]|nr:hypothetical protein [Burkholderiales bacterium]